MHGLYKDYKACILSLQFLCSVSCYNYKCNYCFCHFWVIINSLILRWLHLNVIALLLIPRDRYVATSNSPNFNFSSYLYIHEELHLTWCLWASDRNFFLFLFIFVCLSNMFTNVRLNKNQKVRIRALLTWQYLWVTSYPIFWCFIYKLQLAIYEEKTRIFFPKFDH